MESGETVSRNVTLVVLENGAMKSQPAVYSFTRVKVPSGKNNVFIVFNQINENASIYMAINDQDIRAFTKLLNDAIDGITTTRDKIAAVLDNNVSIVFPRVGDTESMSWICFPSSFEKDPDGNISVSLEWIYYGEERETVMEEIKRIADSDEMACLVKALNDMDERSAESGNVKEKNDAVKVIASQYGLDGLDSRDPVDLVKEIKHYKDFGGKYIMKEIMTDAKIVMIFALKTATAVADELAAAV